MSTATASFCIHVTVRCHLHIMGFSEIAICMKYGQVEETFYRTFCHSLALVTRAVNILGPPWLQPIDITRSLVRIIRKLWVIAVYSLRRAFVLSVF